MHRSDIKKDFDDERDKYDRLATACNNERDRDNRFIDPPKSQDDRRQNMNAPADAWDGNGDSGDGGGDRKLGNTYGLDTRFLKFLGINEPLVTRVFVTNLDYAVDEHKLIEVFKLAGKVLYVELARDKRGKSRGFGMVEYDHPVESVQAISMLHNQKFYDRRMFVRLDKVNEPDVPQKLPEELQGIGRGLGTGGSRLIDVARNIVNVQANNPSIANPVFVPALVAGASGAGLNTVVPAKLANGQGNNASAWRDLSKTDDDVDFDENNALDGSNFAGDRDFESRFNGGDNDRVPSGGLAGNEGEEEGGNKQNTYGLRPTSDSILIKNLPSNATWQMLKNEFQNVGEVKFVAIQRTGTGIVQFVSEWDAVRALCIMNRSCIDGRTIDVCLY